MTSCSRAPLGARQLPGDGTFTHQTCTGSKQEIVLCLHHRKIVSTCNNFDVHVGFSIFVILVSSGDALHASVRDECAWTLTSLYLRPFFFLCSFNTVQLHSLKYDCQRLNRCNRGLVLVTNWSKEFVMNEVCRDLVRSVMGRITHQSVLEAIYPRHRVTELELVPGDSPGECDYDTIKRLEKSTCEFDASVCGDVAP